MFTITLPNQDKKKYNQPTTSMKIAEDISKNLAANAFASIVNGELWDLNRIIQVDSLSLETVQKPHQHKPATMTEV